MSRVQVHKVRKRLQKKKGQKNCPKKPKKPYFTRLFGIGCIFWPMRLAPPAGLEPATSWLTVMRSTDWAKEEYKGNKSVFCSVVRAHFMLTPENIVVLCACACSASKLLIFAISRRKRILNPFSRSPTDWAKEEYCHKGCTSVQPL